MILLNWILDYSVVLLEYFKNFKYLINKLKIHFIFYKFYFLKIKNKKIKNKKIKKIKNKK